MQTGHAVWKNSKSVRHAVTEDAAAVNVSLTYTVCAVCLYDDQTRHKLSYWALSRRDVLKGLE